MRGEHTMHIYDRAAKALDHFERFLTILDGIRDDIYDENFDIRPEYIDVEDTLRFLDDETQGIWRRAEALVREVKRANT
jgi:hypothetical protein